MLHLTLLLWLLADVGSAQGALMWSTVAPMRYSHMANTTANLARWRGSGYHPVDVAAYLGAVRRTLDHPNIALDLRIHLGTEYR